MRITASAICGRPACSAAASSRWQASDCARWASSRQKTWRKMRGMPATARIAVVSRGLAAASRIVRWKASLSAMCSSTAVGDAGSRAAASSLIAHEPDLVGRRDPLGRERCRVRLDQRPDLVQLEQVGAVEGAHHRALVRLERDQPLGLEHQQRLADRRARGAEALRERLGPQPLAGLERALEDRVLQLVADADGARRGGPRLRHGLHTTARPERVRKP